MARAFPRLAAEPARLIAAAEGGQPGKGTDQKARERRQSRPEVARRPRRIAVEPVLGLYVHIPFCSAICNYCNFNRGLYDEALKVRYVEALISHIRGFDADAAGP